MPEKRYTSHRCASTDADFTGLSHASALFSAVTTPLAAHATCWPTTSKVSAVTGMLRGAMAGSMKWLWTRTRAPASTTSMPMKAATGSIEMPCRFMEYSMMEPDTMTAPGIVSFQVIHRSTVDHTRSIPRGPAGGGG